MKFHIPVLVNEVVDLLDPKPGNIVVDGTIGGAGHALALAQKISPDGTLIGIDWDLHSVAFANQAFVDAQTKVPYTIVHGNYRNIPDILKDLQLQSCDRILVDVGISSYDLDQSGRGFSFQKDEPLDMRFNTQYYPSAKRQEPFTAKFIVQHFQEAELEKIFWEYGEEKFSKKIARGIVNVRQQQDIETTAQLFEIIKKSIPGAFRYKASDHARKIFQALRIEVNHELDTIAEFLPNAFEVLRPGGRLAVISFHSLEDRLVKKFFLEKTKGCICPPDFPICVCNSVTEAKIITRKPVTATAQEIAENPRSKSAKLRVLQKI